MMKLIVGLMLIALAINVSIAVPVRDPSEDAEFIDVPKQNPRSRVNVKEIYEDDVDPLFPGDKGVVDTGVGYPFLQPLPHSVPFSFNLGFFDTFDDLFRRLHTRLWPIDVPKTSSEEDDFSLKIDPAKGGNTTSVVKVVDGHKIEINDTVYSNADKSGGAVFKFRIINIRPLDDSSEEGSAAPATNIPIIRNPITSAPNSPAKSNEEDNDVNNNNSDERKESMEDKDPLNNEIQGNPDEPEVKSKKNA